MDDGREYFIFHDISTWTSKQLGKRRPKKEGEIVEGLVGQAEAGEAGVDDIAGAIGEAVATHTRTVHRGPDLEEQTIYPIINKKVKIELGSGFDVSYVRTFKDGTLEQRLTRLKLGFLS